MLSHIFQTKHTEVEAAKAKTSLEALKDQAAAASKPRGFLNALRRGGPMALIAEIKMASPSEGTIRPDLDPAEIASIYEGAGAHALSVLTDHTYFQGSPFNLKQAHRASLLPILRKDFIDDPYQIYEARAWGADAILLIVAALEQQQLIDLHGLAHELGMDVLVEVHTLAETHRALDAKVPLIGVNNRDLSDFQTDLTYSETLLPQIVPHAFAVSESGLHEHKDIAHVQNYGAGAVLIGTAFCRAEDIGAKVREVMGWHTREGL